MTKLCLRERAENGEDGMAKFVLEDPATHLTSVSCDVTMVVTVILMMMVLMSGMIMLFANPRSPWQRGERSEWCESASTSPTSSFLPSASSSSSPSSSPERWLRRRVVFDEGQLGKHLDLCHNLWCLGDCNRYPASGHFWHINLANRSTTNRPSNHPYCFPHRLFLSRDLL